MKEKELRRSRSVFPIGTVMQLTDLTARQIRYYEEQQLIFPKRNEGNHRVYSLNDIDTLLEIKDYLAEGINMAGIKELYLIKEQKKEKRQAEISNPITDEDVRRILHSEFLKLGGLTFGNDDQLKPSKKL